MSGCPSTQSQDASRREQSGNIYHTVGRVSAWQVSSPELTLGMVVHIYLQGQGLRGPSRRIRTSGPSSTTLQAGGQPVLHETLSQNTKHLKQKRGWLREIQSGNGLPEKDELLAVRAEL